MSPRAENEVESLTRTRTPKPTTDSPNRGKVQVENTFQSVVGLDISIAQDVNLREIICSPQDSELDLAGLVGAKMI